MVARIPSASLQWLHTLQPPLSSRAQRGARWPDSLGARIKRDRELTQKKRVQGVRGMATAGMKTAKAPAQTFGVSGRYASALWQHANSVGKLETVQHTHTH